MVTTLPTPVAASLALTSLEVAPGREAQAPAEGVPVGKHAQALGLQAGVVGDADSTVVGLPTVVVGADGGEVVRGGHGQPEGQARQADAGARPIGVDPQQVVAVARVTRDAARPRRGRERSGMVEA
jgi:hypothetical protein